MQPLISAFERLNGFRRVIGNSFRQWSAPILLDTGEPPSASVFDTTLSDQTAPSNCVHSPKDRCYSRETPHVSQERVLTLSQSNRGSDTSCRRLFPYSCPSTRPLSPRFGCPVLHHLIEDQ